MSEMQHIYLTAHGEWVATPWIGETAQIGLRMAFAPTLSTPARGTIFDLQSNGDVDIDTGSATGTHGVLARTWKCRIGGVGSLNNVLHGDQVDMCEDMWTFLDAIKSSCVSGFHWTHMKIAPIAPDGSYGEYGSATYSLSSDLAGTASSNPLPPSTALAVSLRAPIVGRRGRGRVYLPGLAASSTILDANGEAGGGFRSGVASAFEQLINDLEDRPGWDTYKPIVCVMSAGSLDAVRPTQVRVGSQWDVQTRRQRQVPESYTALDIAD